MYFPGVELLLAGSHQRLHDLFRCGDSRGPRSPRRFECRRDIGINTGETSSGVVIPNFTDSTDGPEHLNAGAAGEHLKLLNLAEEIGGFLQ